MVSNPQHEPTMEEILASIRKIISEDSSESPQAAPAPAQPAAAAAPAPQPAQAMADPEPDGDVLELTQPIEEVPEPAPLPEPEPEQDEVVFQSIEEAAVSSAPAEAPQADGFFSDKTRQAMDETFDNIPPEAPAAPRDPAAPIASLNGANVEAVVDRAIREAFEPVLAKWLGDNSGAIIDRMKPVIREWMDEHFPDLLEEAVRSEVARRARKR